MVQIPLFDKSTGPDPIDDLLPLNEISVIAKQQQQDLGRLWRESNYVTVAPQHPLFRIETELAKFIKVLRCLRHSGY
jgi:hypothetical protein